MAPGTTVRSSIPYVLILTVAIVAIYGQTLTFDFINYDDPELVKENTAFLSDPLNIVRSFSTHAFTTHKTESVYYRPVLLISYIIDYQIWKSNPAGYHLTNLILHILTSVLVFFLATFILKNPFASLLTALLFALHPVQVESVAWIAGRNDILLGFFIALMLLFYQLYRSPGIHRQRYFYFSFAAFTAALFTKESAAFYTLVIPLHDSLLRRRGETPLPAKTRIRTYAWFLIMIAMYLVIRLQIFGTFIGAEKLYGTVPFLSRIELIPVFIIENFRFLILPVHLSIDHPLDQIIWTGIPWLWLAWMLTIFIITFTWLNRKNPSVYGIIWIGIGLLPVLNMFPMAVPIFEHRLYSVLIGFSIFIGMFFYNNRIFNNTARVVIVFCIVLTAAILSYSRIPAWHDSKQLWSDAIKKEPDGSRPYMGLGSYYLGVGEFAQSIPVLKKYIELRPDDPDGFGKLRQAYYAIGNRDEAAGISKELIKLQPHEPARYLETAMLYEELNLPDTAIKFYREGILIDPVNPAIPLRIGKIYDRLQKADSAEFYYKTSLRLNEKNDTVYLLLGNLYRRNNNIESAMRILEKGLTVAQPSAEYLRTLSDIYRQLNQTDRHILLRQHYSF